MESRAPAAPGRTPWLALPTGSVVLASNTDIAATNPREKNQLSEEATREESGKKLAKQKKSSQSWAKRCAPIGGMVVVPGSLPGRSPAILADKTPAHRADGKL
jgi:hypothetical protein